MSTAKTKTTVKSKPKAGKKTKVNSKTIDVKLDINDISERIKSAHQKIILVDLIKQAGEISEKLWSVNVPQELGHYRDNAEARLKEFGMWVNAIILMNK